MKLFDTFVDFATTASSITLSFTVFGLIAMPISTETACGISIRNELLYENIKNKYKKCKKHFEKDQQTIECFDKKTINLYSIMYFDKKDFESLCNIF